MVRLVHTADVHLHPDAPERRRALETVLERAEAVDADAVTIGGDLFEDAVAAERLRPELRSLFVDRSFPVVVIPGNHDRTAFEGDAFFGPAVRPATGEPFETISVAGGEARITCVPYTPRLDDDLLVALRDREPVEGLDCLLLHCSLEGPATATAGEEDEVRYCPVGRGTLAGLGFDVVLAGHYHGANRVALPGDDGPGGTFVYPGSPASVTDAEIGRRSVAIVDDAAEPPVRLDPIESYHVDELELRVRPGEADEALQRIREAVDRWDEHGAAASITVEGFVERDESAFADALAAAAGPYPLENRTRSVATLVDHPIYEAFSERLDAETTASAAERDDWDADALAADARQRVLAAVADLAAEGELT